MAIHIGRRKFIATLGGVVAAWPLAARAQQTAMPVIGYIGFGSLISSVLYLAAFRKGLGETGFIEGQNVAIEYRWLEGQYDRMPELAADLVRRGVAVIATPGTPPTSIRAAMATTATIPIVFAVADDPVKWGIVASLGRPNSNATGINFFASEVLPKRLGLLHDVVPGAARIAVLLNPADPTRAKMMLSDLQTAARTLGLQIETLYASTGREIEGAFATLAGQRAGALFVGPDGFFNSRRVQLAMLAARHAIPATYSVREYVEAGGLMSYGTSVADFHRQVGVYTGRILKGAKPVDLPVLQSVKFELVINLQTARMLSLDVPPSLIAEADDVIE
jgi:putative tryptophan/tyrosine transport system substrate-binding protein